MFLLGFLAEYLVPPKMGNSICQKLSLIETEKPLVAGGIPVHWCWHHESTVNRLCQAEFLNWFCWCSSQGVLVFHEFSGKDGVETPWGMLPPKIMLLPFCRKKHQLVNMFINRFHYISGYPWIDVRDYRKARKTTTKQKKGCPSDLPTISGIEVLFRNPCKSYNTFHTINSGYV